jgi:hypothetical protein
MAAAALTQFLKKEGSSAEAIPLHTTSLAKLSPQDIALKGEQL